MNNIPDEILEKIYRYLVICKISKDCDVFYFNKHTYKIINNLSKNCKKIKIFGKDLCKNCHNNQIKSIQYIFLNRYCY